MENLSTEDFFNGLVSQAVEHGQQDVWDPNGGYTVQPYQGERGSQEKQAILYTVETEDGQKFFVTLSKDGKICAISNDKNLAYEMYWRADMPAGQDGIDITPNTDLRKWHQPTSQQLAGSLGFVKADGRSSKYVTSTTKGTRELPEGEFAKILENISKEVQTQKELVQNMSGRKDSKEILIQAYDNSLKNIEGLTSLLDTISRAYEGNEIKENMARIATLREELARINIEIERLKEQIKESPSAAYVYGNAELEALESRRTNIIDEVGSGSNSAPEI